MSTSLKIGDTVSYKNWECPVIGFYKKIMDSSTSGYILVAPCEAKEATHVRLKPANIVSVRGVRKAKNPKFSLEGVERYIDNHKQYIKKFKAIFSEEDMALDLCFKVRK